MIMQSRLVQTLQRIPWRCLSAVVWFATASHAAAQSPAPESPATEIPSATDAIIDLDSTHAKESHAVAVLQKLGDDYQIQMIGMEPEFPVRTTHGMIEGRAATEQALRMYLRWFPDEFRLYPVEAIRNSRLRRVILCAELKFAGQFRTAIPDFEHNTLYLDIERASTSRIYQILVFHHELFHVFDYADDFRVYEDAAWVELNEDDFRYGSGGKNAQDNPETSVLTDRYPGFLNHYSTTGVEEDKAELFANLVVRAKTVERRAESDPVLRTKCDRMRELLHQFCPELDDQFWLAAKKLKRFR
jgi:hypothetical protein